MLDEFVAERDSPARLKLLAEAEQILTNLEPIPQKMRVDPDAAGRLENAETTGERPDPLGEHEGEPESVAGRRAHLAVVGRARRVGGVHVDLFEARLASRAVADFHGVVLVFPRLEAQF